MCALNPDRGTVVHQSLCRADYRAIGNQWIEFSFGCGYHAGTVTVALQQIQSGQVIVVPATETPGMKGAEPTFST